LADDDAATAGERGALRSGTVESGMGLRENSLRQLRHLVACEPEERAEPLHVVGAIFDDENPRHRLSSASKK
jgi:hypothetical protein